MFVKSEIGCRFNLRHLGQGSIDRVREKLRHRSDRVHGIVGVFANVVFYCVPKNEVVDVTTLQQALGIGIGAGSCTASVDVNFPADAGTLQSLENRLRRNQSSVGGIVSSLIDITV